MELGIRAAESDDFLFAFHAKKEAMGPHIRAQWEWDEAFQLTLHKQRWMEKPWYILTLNNRKIGTLSLAVLANNILRFGEFYILDEYRNKGLGTSILCRTLVQSDRNHQTVVLEYLKWNPVGVLYKRHGFKVTGENEIYS